MVRVPTLAVVLALVGCDGGSSAPLDIVVLVESHSYGRYATVVIREPFRPCSCHWELDGDDACEHSSDVLGCSCEPSPGACVQEIRAETDGEVYSRARPGESYYGSLSVELPVEADDMTLVMVGCGGIQVAALPASDPVDGPRFVELTSDEEEFTVHWDGAETADRILSTAYGLFGGQSCEVDRSSELRFPRYLEIMLGVEARYGVDQSQGLLGKIRVWNVAGASTAGDVRSLSPLGDGSWQLPGGSGTVALMIDDRIDGGALLADVTVRLVGPLDESIVINGDSWDIEGMGQFWFRAGSASDSLEVEWGSRTYAGSFPHQVPVDPLVLGRPEFEGYEVHLGPVTLTDVADATRTITTSMELRWEVGVVARPVP